MRGGFLFKTLAFIIAVELLNGDARPLKGKPAIDTRISACAE